MRPLTYTTPKPLIKLGGKPLLERLVSNFPKKITDLIIVVGYLGEQIKSHCGDTFCGRPVTYVWQKEKKGTYHALEICKDLLDPNESFAVFLADDLLDQATIENCLAHDLAVIAKRVNDPRKFGVVVLNDDGSIKNIVEKPQKPESNLALTNGQVLSKHIFSYAPAPNQNGEQYLSVAIASMARDHKIFQVEAEFWFPIATPDDLKKAEEVIYNRS